MLYKTISLLIGLSFGVAKPVQIVNMYFGETAVHHTRLVLEFTDIVSYNIFSFQTPPKLVIELKNTDLVKPLVNPLPLNPVIKRVNSLSHSNGLQIILELTASVRTKSYLLKATDTKNHRLVIDINTLPELSNLPSSDSSTTSNFQSSISNYQLSTSSKDFVVAIDAGHGGIDGGAVGVQGTLEKDVTMAIAIELAKLIATAPNMRAVLIRNGDYFLKLSKRVELARQYQADLLVSIHADAFPSNKRVFGSAVYMLSQQGASSEAARWLAQKENAADLVGGVSLEGRSDLLAQVLLDLSQAGTLEKSAQVAEKVIAALGKEGAVRSKEVQRADFLVLRAPDIPSILIETGFLSNPHEEQQLNDPQVRHRIASAIFDGIRAAKQLYYQ